MKRRHLFLFALLVPSLLPAQVSLTFVGTTARGVSADGRVVVGDEGSTGFRYTVGSGSYEALPFAANDVNRDGSIVVGVDRGTNRAHQWSGGMVSELSDLPTPVGNIWIAADTYKIAGNAISGGGGLFTYDGTTVTPFGDPFSEPFGISADGSAIVGLRLGGPFLHKDGTFTDLADQGLDFASAISHDGSTIVGNTITSGAYLDAAGLHLIPLPDGGNIGLARPDAVNADGSLIAGGYSAFPDDAAFVWTRLNGTVPLANFVTLPEGWFLGHVLDVSADGRVLVGQAWNLDGSEARGFIVSGLDFQPVPEPSTYGAIAGAMLIGLLVWRRRRNQIVSR